MDIESDVVVVGAGLAGLVAAYRLGQLGHASLIVDASLPEAEGALGGFAKFSGAKFSLPPAGMGLLSVVDTEEDLWAAIGRVETILDLDFSSVKASSDRSVKLGSLREYRSLVLNPDEIDSLLRRLTAKLNDHGINVIHGRVTRLGLDSSVKKVQVSTSNSEMTIGCDCVFYAGGRLGTDLLLEIGIETTNIKGLDVGFRVEFPTSAGLENLRALGPDAKIIQDNCRTFCLNVPGQVFRYPFADISIPGGIVASDAVSACNVGILYRSQDKEELLSRILANAKKVPLEQLEIPFHSKGSPLGDSEELVQSLYGESIAASLNQFSEYLSASGLIDWNVGHVVHIPLIDWHWGTFSQSGTFATSNKSLYCLGDSSGHARGLLQAAVSGLLAAEEYDAAS